MWDESPIFDIDSKVKEKSLVLFGQQVSSTDIWVVTKVEGDFRICEQLTSQSICFSEKKFHKDELDCGDTFND